MNVKDIAKIKEVLRSTTDDFLTTYFTDLVQRNEAWRAAFVPGAPIRSRDRTQTGQVTGEERECDTEDCPGYMFQVGWEDGFLGWVCATDVEQMEDDSWALVDWDRSTGTGTNASATS